MILDRFLIDKAIQYAFVSLNFLARVFRMSATCIQFDNYYDAELVLGSSHSVLDIWVPFFATNFSTI